MEKSWYEILEVTTRQQPRPDGSDKWEADWLALPGDGLVDYLISEGGLEGFAEITLGEPNLLGVVREAPPDELGYCRMMWLVECQAVKGLSTHLGDGDDSLECGLVRRLERADFAALQQLAEAGEEA